LPEPTSPRTPPAGSHRLRLLAPLVAVAVALVAALFLVHAGSGGSSPGRTPDTGQSVPISVDAGAWDLPRLDGPGEVRLRDFRGKPTVVNFFASWCGPCRAELPVLVSMAAQLGDRVHFVGVDSEEQGDGLAMARQYGAGGWPLAQDVAGRMDSGLHDALGARGMPITAFYDAQGRLLTVKLGSFLHETLRDKLNQLYGVGAT
jgi:cytochrome c biogenesis protein CcmG/thiol:disulfide interchange protein DsbE